ncbi:MAG TPA: hypothetical protein VGJ84_18295 [Polyangiaceae bacterium]|jgi:hypothetical protein
MLHWAAPQSLSALHCGQLAGPAWHQPLVQPASVQTLLPSGQVRQIGAVQSLGLVHVGPEVEGQETKLPWLQDPFKHRCALQYVLPSRQIMQAGAGQSASTVHSWQLAGSVTQ